MAGPLDELVARLNRMVAAFARENGVEQAQVVVELVDGSRYVVATTASDPGFGFLSFVPYDERGDEPRCVVVPVGAVRSVEISRPDPESPFGFVVTE
jgi:hypothetical protein